MGGRAGGRGCLACSSWRTFKLAAPCRAVLCTTPLLSCLPAPTPLTDDDTLHSELVVYDARTMAATPVVRLRMPQRVPHGFHGHWVTAAQLAAQAAA